MSDKEVILKIKNGEIDCFEVLVKKYSKIVYNYLFSKLKKKEDCEDLLQEIFLSFYKNLTRFNEQKPALPYLFAIAKNELKMFYRKRKFILPLKEEIVKEENHFESFADIDISLLGELNKLNKKEKIIFEMLGQGYKIKEIAEELKIKENTIKSMIRRGRIKLKIKK
jgi:RNA polymerase sigma-70 factor (ECF subfamily)